MGMLSPSTVAVTIVPSCIHLESLDGECMESVF